MKALDLIHMVPEVEKRLADDLSKKFMKCEWIMQFIKILKI